MCLLLPSGLISAKEEANEARLAELAKAFREAKINDRGPILEKLAPLIEAHLKKEYPTDARAYFTRLLGKPDGREIDASEPYRTPLGFVERNQEDHKNIFCYVLKKEGDLTNEVMIDARPPGPPTYYGAFSVEPPATDGESEKKNGQQGGGE